MNPRSTGIPATRRRRRSHRRGSAILKPIGGRWSTSSSGTLTNCQTRSSRPTRRSSTSGMSSGWRSPPEIAYAEDGDIEPLRKKLPHLAKFLRLPPWPKHKRKTPGYLLSFQAQRAADMVPEVRALRERTYGKTKQFKPTAEEIVADIWGVTVAEVKLGLRIESSGKRARKNILKRKKITRLGKRRSPAKTGVRGTSKKSVS